ncbi:hypothetical protein GCM10007425_26320 [Lysinibacillus alkalisoli]|uniref:TIGR02206 family membrane protein n=1 Tax=Lysinibacillus alkalisoli TaxID=1911548 RepID=A0A917G969_9BACI|nr:hypothetical protein GCM10007425_26320 [Lysinibacillus alkalisoli]
MRNAEKIQKTKLKHYLRYIFISIIVVQQVLLYSWYAMNHEWYASDALPLYPCRLTTLLVLMMLIIKRPLLLSFTFYWGLIGAFLALLSPETGQLGFPNAMFIQFFMGHSALFLGVIYLAILFQFTVNEKALYKVYRQSLVYFGLLLMINTTFNTNYAYLRELPPSVFLNWVPSYPWYIPIEIAVIFILFYLLYYVCQKWQREI